MRPFQDRAGADVGTSVRHFRGLLRVPVPVFCCVLVLLSIVGPTSCGEGKGPPGRDPRCPGKAIVRTGGRRVPEHTVWDRASF